MSISSSTLSPPHLLSYNLILLYSPLAPPGGSLGPLPCPSFLIGSHLKCFPLFLFPRVTLRTSLQLAFALPRRPPAHLHNTSQP